MPRHLRQWTAFLALTAAPVLGGCGQQPAANPAAEPVTQFAAPQRLAIPTDALPLLRESHDLAVAQAGGRILALHPQSPGEQAPLIREPAASVIREPAAPKPYVAAVASPPRSQFVPLDVPSAAAPSPQYQPPPTQSQWSPPTQPQFVAAAAPTASASMVPGIQPDRAAMKPVSERAAMVAQRAYVNAQRGMLYSARADLIQALQLVAQALDVQAGANQHGTSLSAGLTAMHEARDFAPQPGRDALGVPVVEIARTHKTPVLKTAGTDLSPVAAQQRYYQFAQQQLVAAVAGEPAASQALFALGKIQSAMGSQSAAPQALHGAQAMVYYQAALTVDSRNYLAANELGVLLAQYGQLPDARRVLLHSVNTRPHQEGWYNLAVVHRRLGESELARLAEGEQKRMAERQTGPQPSKLAANVIRWVDPQTFARSSGPDDGQPPQVAAGSAPTANTRR